MWELTLQPLHQSPKRKKERGKAERLTKNLLSWRAYTCGRVIIVRDGKKLEMEKKDSREWRIEGQITNGLLVCTKTLTRTSTKVCEVHSTSGSSVGSPGLQQSFLGRNRHCSCSKNQVGQVGSSEHTLLVIFQRSWWAVHVENVLCLCSSQAVQVKKVLCHAKLKLVRWPLKLERN